MLKCCRRCCRPSRCDADARLLDTIHPDHNNAVARKRAVAAISELRRGCANLQEVVLPAGGADILAALRNNLRQLDALVGQVTAPLTLPWPRPLPEEQALFEESCPAGGVLLRTQTCVASRSSEDPERLIGRLFISDTGLLLEECDGVIPSPGLIKWDSIVDLQSRPDEAGPSTSRASHSGNLTVTLGTPHAGSFHLQLGFSSDAEWIIKAWKLCTEDSGDGVLEVDSREMPGETLLEYVRFHSFEEGSFDRALDQSDESASTRRPIALTASMSAALATLPEAPAISPRAPLLTAVYKDFTFETLCAQFEAEEWFLDPFMIETLHAMEMRTMPWKKGVRAGAMVRETRITMPLPPDVPRPVARILGMPSELTVTAVFQYRRTAEEAVVIMHSATPGVLYGDHFRVEDIIRIRPHPDGTAELRKWTEAVWVKPLPWTLGFVKKFIEFKVRSEAKAGARTMDRMIGELGARVGAAAC